MKDTKTLRDSWSLQILFLIFFYTVSLNVFQQMCQMFPTVPTVRRLPTFNYSNFYVCSKGLNDFPMLIFYIKLSYSAT